MTDSVLDILKLALLGLLYLFFARVLWAVWSEVRSPETRSASEPAQAAALINPSSSGGMVNPLRHETGDPTRLVIIEPKKRKGSAFEIEGVIGIGRESDNTVMIAGDAFVSSYHARVWTSDGQILIDDRGSKNGTFVNGAKLEGQKPLHTGDRIQIGYTILEARE